MGFFDPFGGAGGSGGSGGTIVPGNYATKAELTSEAEKRASADKELQTGIKANAESVSELEKSVEELQTSKANVADVYNKEETDDAITAKVSEIVAGAPEEFDTLKEMSDWLTEHEDSAAAMNTAIQANTKAIADNATVIEGNITDIEQNKNDIAVNRNTLGTQRVNIFDGELKKGDINLETGNNLDNDSAVITKNYIAVTPNAIISISRTENSGYMAWRFYDENKNYLGVANNSNIKLIHGDNVSNILTQQRNFGCFKLINPKIKYVRFRDMTNSLSNVYTVVEGEYTEDTMPANEPYVPSINERLTANENDILSAQNQIKNQTLITSSGDMSSVNWYRVFEADRKTSARNGLLMISRGFSNGIPESYILAFQMGFYSTDFKFNLVTKLNEDASAYIDKVRVVFKNDDSASSNKCYIDIHYNLDKSNIAYISILGTSNAVNFPFKAVDFSAAEIPEGYTSYEFDLTGKDVFDRLTVLEAALAQTTTASE